MMSDCTRPWYSMSALDKISDPLSDWKADMPQPTRNMAPSASPKFGITANKTIAPPNMYAAVFCRRRSCSLGVLANATEVITAPTAATVVSKPRLPALRPNRSATTVGRKAWCAKPNITTPSDITRSRTSSGFDRV